MVAEEITIRSHVHRIVAVTYVMSQQIVQAVSNYLFKGITLFHMLHAPDFTVLCPNDHLPLSGNAKKNICFRT